MCAYIHRLLKKRSIKVGWILYLLWNIYGELFKLAGINYVALQFFYLWPESYSSHFPKSGVGQRRKAQVGLLYLDAL